MIACGKDYLYKIMKFPSFLKTCRRPSLATTEEGKYLVSNNATHHFTSCLISKARQKPHKRLKDTENHKYYATNIRPTYF